MVAAYNITFKTEKINILYEINSGQIEQDMSLCNRIKEMKADKTV